MALLEKLILVLLVFALPLAEVTRFPFSEIAITFLDIGVVIVVVLWFILRKRIPSSNLNKPILIFIVTLFISLLVNTSRLSVNELLISSLYMVRWIIYASLFFVVLDLSSFKKKIEKGMVISGAILVAIGYVLYFLYPDLRNLRYAGWDEHLYRMFSTFLDPNFAGSFFVLYFLFVSKHFNFKDKKTLILPLFTLIAIFLTFSRSAFIMLAAAIVVYSFFLKQKKAAISFIVLIISSMLLISSISLKSEGTNLLRTASGEARLDSLRNAFVIFKDHPIFGVGFNSYRYAQRDFGFINEKKMIIHSGAGTDNSFLFILATSGVVGLLGFLYLMLNMIQVKEPLVISSIVALMVNSLFINSLFYPPIMFWMWVLIGIRLKNT